ncbi:ubiquitin specific protease [Anaeramoeba flamelloides]|uniref:Mediator of RNA polymerase II transcription subunit 20 n=1 Tax=Anaeramoeba flamelloides TaxID=1746091 RepID=A0ABQ8XGM8_9EUKA|nr:ubiquitin specific protease [Anaeramoeba flamelloides]
MNSVVIWPDEFEVSILEKRILNFGGTTPTSWSCEICEYISTQEKQNSQQLQRFYFSDSEGVYYLLTPTDQILFFDPLDNLLGSLGLKMTKRVAITGVEYQLSDFIIRTGHVNINTRKGVYLEIVVPSFEYNFPEDGRGAKNLLQNLFDMITTTNEKKLNPTIHYFELQQQLTNNKENQERELFSKQNSMGPYRKPISVRTIYNSLKDSGFIL